MFTLVSQPWNRPVPTLQENILINHLQHLASDLGGGNLKPNRGSYFLAGLESQSPGCTVTGWSPPTAPYCPSPKSQSPEFYILFHIAVWHPIATTSFHSHNNHKLTSYCLFLGVSPAFKCYTGFYKVGNLTSLNSFEMINVTRKSNSFSNK